MIINILTILIFLNNDQIKNDFTNDSSLISLIKSYANSTTNKCLSNIANIFLEDFNILNK